MDVFQSVIILFLVLNLVFGLVRVLWGPNTVDRLLGAQLFGTLGVAILLLLAGAGAVPALRDVALVLAILAPIATAAFVKRTAVEA